MTNYRILLHCILISSSLFTLCIAVRPRSRAIYGEFCDNRAVRCDSNLSLSCKNSTCVCMKPENMIYDPARSACAVLASEKCIYTVLDQYRNWQEELLCVTNASCDITKGICICNKDHIELSNGTCIPKKNYLDPCEASSDCRQDLSLVCLESKCQCNRTTSEYSSSLNQCVGLANEPCVNDLCTPNAICREEPSRIYAGTTSIEVEDSSDEDYSDLLRDPSIGRCQCRTAFGVTSDKRCKLGYGGKCDHQLSVCMDWLKCKEGTCVCKYPTHQIYDKVSEKCLSYVGGPCTDPEAGKNSTDKIGCINGAICSRGKNSSKHRCQCPEGYIENMDRGCDLDYGQRCRTQLSPTYSTRQATTSSSSSTHAMNNAKCDRIGKLYCIDGRCQCEDDLHVYDLTTKMCRGLAGATCNVKLKDGGCVSGAHCKARRGFHWTGNNEGGTDSSHNGICTCLEYYREADDRTCSVLTQANEIKGSQHGGSAFTLKSGRTSDFGVAGSGLVDKKFNSTVNSLWNIFDEVED